MKYRLSSFFSDRNKQLLATLLVILILLFLISCDMKPSSQTPAVKSSNINESPPGNDSTNNSFKTDNAPVSLTEKGRKLLIGGELEKAMDYLNRAIKENPKNSKAYLWRGILHERMVEWDKAMEDYEKARDLDPGAPDPYAYIGLLFIVRDGKIGKAIKNFMKANKIRHKHKLAFMGFGMIYMFKEEYSHAKMYFDVVISDLKNPDDPENAILFEERGYANYYLKQYENARDDFLHSIRLD